MGLTEIDAEFMKGCEDPASDVFSCRGSVKVARAARIPTRTEGKRAVFSSETITVGSVPICLTPREKTWSEREAARRQMTPEEFTEALLKLGFGAYEHDGLLQELGRKRMKSSRFVLQKGKTRQSGLASNGPGQVEENPRG
jgi:hypothetical protein